jgi:microcystin-dependent protein
MGIKLSNNATSRLAGGLTNTETTISLVPGDGAKFPVISDVTDWFPLTLVKSTGESEIVRVTARTTDTLTVTRAQEGTTAIVFNAGDRAELRLTAGVFTTLTAEMMTALAAQGTQLAALLPPGAGPIPWSRSTEPAGWIFADGRTLLSSTIYTALRAAYIADGFPHGQDGSGNPKIPDMRGVVPAGLDNMGGTAANRLTGATAISALLGAETVALTQGQMPIHTHANTLAAGGSHNHGGTTAAGGAHTPTGSTGSAGSHSHTFTNGFGSSGGSGISAGSDSGSFQMSGTTDTVAAHTHTLSISAVPDHTHAITTQVDHTHTLTNASAGSGDAHPNVQPTRVFGYVVKT